jgi:hypothetical protein
MSVFPAWRAFLSLSNPDCIGLAQECFAELRQMMAFPVPHNFGIHAAFVGDNEDIVDRQMFPSIVLLIFPFGVLSP